MILDLINPLALPAFIMVQKVSITVHENKVGKLQILNKTNLF